MNKQQEALRLALEALEETRNALAWFYDSYPQDVTKKGNDLLPHVETVLAAIREALADSALDRMAENARELGLDYEPPCKTGSQCTNKCQQCEQPAQEPVAWPCVIAEADFEKDTITLEMQCSDYMVRAGQHWLSTSPQPSKPWVGLTDAEIDELDRKNYGFPQPVAWRGPFARAVEAKLKERNA